MGPEVLETLVAKTAEVVPKQGQWTVYYLGLARGGWNTEAKAWANRPLPTGASWSAVRVSLYDLESIDADLASGGT